MRAVIVVHSQSGHTVLLARAIADRLRHAGHETDIHLLRTQGVVKPRAPEVTIKNPPDLSDCDCVLVGGPVWGFTASPVILSLLSRMAPLKGKTAVPFVTMGLPLRAFGANQALSRMRAKLEALGATVLPGEALRWFVRANKERIEQTTERLSERVLDIYGAGEGPVDETPRIDRSMRPGTAPGKVEDPDGEMNGSANER